MLVSGRLLCTTPAETVATLQQNDQITQRLTGWCWRSSSTNTSERWTLRCCSSSSHAVHQPNYTALLTCATGSCHGRPAQSTASQERRPVPPRRQRGCPKDEEFAGLASVSQLRRAPSRCGSFIFNLLDCWRCSNAVDLVLPAVGRADVGVSRSGSPIVGQVGVWSTPSVEASGNAGLMPGELAPPCWNARCRTPCSSLPAGVGR